MTWVAMEVMHGGRRIPLSAIRLYMMGIIPSLDFDMCRNSLLTISYLLKGEHEDLESLSLLIGLVT